MPILAVGIDLGGSHIKAGVVSARGKVYLSLIHDTPANAGPKAIISALKATTLGLLKQSRSKHLIVRGIGIGSPGTVDRRTGRVIGSSPNLPGWVGINLKQALSEFKLPVLVDNDANLMALAEQRTGAARRFKNALCLTIGTGIGGGILIDGKLFHGPNFSAGELGHTSIDFAGRLCRCGSIGCLEAYASVPALLESARTLIRNSTDQSALQNLNGKVTLRQIFSAADKKDRLANQIIDSEIEYLSAGLANVVNLLNPEIIVIGGGLILETDDWFLRKLQLRIRKKAFPAAIKNLRLAKARLGNQAGFIGAALYALESLSND
jgi:glucokinase